MNAARAALLAVVALAALAGGCGLGPGKGAKSVSLTVTDGFGNGPVGLVRSAKAPGSETVMRYLERHFKVTTRYGGGFVQSIDGRAGQLHGATRIDWFFYVNGIESSKGAASLRLHPGDRVWWDRHDWSATMSVPAVVGSFPEPFRSGRDGKRLPVTAACTPAAGDACDAAKARLGAAGVTVSTGPFGLPSGERTLRVLVGPWSELRRDPVAHLIDEGPQASGVYARFDSTGRTLDVLDSGGHTARSLGAGAGLVAATRERDQAPTWVVSGTDSAGVMAAARALDEDVLRNRFALALQGGTPIAAPAGGGAS